MLGVPPQPEAGALPAPPSGLRRVAVLPGLALTVSTFLAAQALARFQGDSDFRAESAYLGLLVALEVAALAAAAAGPALEAGSAALLSLLALWVLPPGTGRSAVVLAVLVGAYLTCAARRLAASHKGSGEEEGSPPTWTEAAALAVPLALGAQLLLRGEVLIEPLADPRTLGRLLALPLLAAGAGALLAARVGIRPAALATGSLLLLRPGFDVASTLALVAIAAGAEAFGPRRPRDGKAGGEPAGARPDRARRLLAFAALLAPVAWEPRSGLAAAAAGLAAGGGGPAALPAVGVGAALALVDPLRPWAEALPLLAWVPLILPGLVLPREGRREALLGALALAVGAARGVPGAPALAAPLALAALCAPRRGVPASAQRTWTALLFGGTALLASYPWMRRSALADALALTGVSPGLAAAAGVLAGMLGLAPLLRIPRLRRRLPPAALVGGAAALAVIAAVPDPGRVLVRRGPVVLDAARPEQGVDLDRPRVSEVMVESRLVHAAALAAATPVATLRLRDDRGETHLYDLEAGRDTGEWAARRPDLRALGTVAAPSPWRTQLDPSGEFFAQTYRTRFRLRGPVLAARLEVGRNPALPAEVALLLQRVELRP